ncbi:2-succinyl-5-enolpyruvyl-6-hydroxy-3-cyclohexene- 1-carboxylate synthase [Nocardioides psychrotolerans]|uniref:2-succinyl-5-enolpyruvyl-6-hydroxy-3-cyclohexene-1-carboxylate synthase n=1 Tax=Nocardioides psychrotolerans TaxID=1005945 RepID=A0A1I3I3Y0_9ACTN|nr:2-succinyl-5-enolpyruvyl-6-hydroxy-3-cyclohexene-1-carboxylic-acid synthase [Nocardioides psychrotolerans]GEP38613.1 2-succinyl-5-enolpyruvyl-6-hydroxy-3-cyclohexene- 1-carboxylate synthase [Nocardioides psychrotolerans]SFI42676.1 2-succinyl-5-enolpyruvyl-6-hydroxy-3-cyclohexene-1-carboxylate synthase [Nocardioides psychrotolerans]
MNPSTQLARAVVSALVRAGVCEVVVSPGSRNAPLSFAALAAASAGAVRLHTRIDERSAGFLALGLTRSHARAAVVCTSGTAVANLHPAVLEAAHAGVPIVVVTADRPGRLRGTDANQTTDQVGIFGRLVPTHDLAAGGALPELDVDGPLHLNLQLDDPLLPDDDRADDGWVPAAVAPAGRRAQGAEVTPVELPLGPRTVVVAGDDAAQGARRVAEAARWPLLAEPTSGSRTGENALRCYRLLLDSDLGRSIERVVVLGHPTLSRPVTRLLGRAEVEVVSVRSRGVWAQRPYAVALEVGGVSVTGVDDPAWLARWLEADRDVARRLDALLVAEADLTPYEVAGVVSRALAPGDQLVVGASSPIRDLDLMVRPYPVGSRRKTIANRGLAGIDGTISTAIGAALGRETPGRTIALMGDVTFLHDSNGLVLGPHEPRPDLTIVVVNDDGGSIFTMLEQGAPEHAAGFERLFGTPHGVDLASLCAATRTPHWRVESLPELEQALSSPNGGIEVVEVRVRRDNRRELDARIRALGD